MRERGRGKDAVSLRVFLGWQLTVVSGGGKYVSGGSARAAREHGRRGQIHTNVDVDLGSS